MGLDAAVFCDCFEKGLVRKPPPQPELVSVGQTGEPWLKWDDPGADQNAFYEWLKSRCDHDPLGELISHRLGNVALIGLLRELIGTRAAEFPLILGRLLYDGMHAGDYISVSDLEPLASEVDRLTSVHSEDAAEEGFIRGFEKQMAELVQVARSVRKPIVF